MVGLAVLARNNIPTVPLSCLILLIMRFIGFNTILKLLMTKPLVNGFTSACSLWVLSAQFNNFLELKIPKIPGYFSLFKRGYEIVKNFKNVNVPTLIVSVISIVLLYGLKEMNLWYKNKYSSQSVWPCELFHRVAYF